MMEGPVYLKIAFLDQFSWERRGNGTWATRASESKVIREKVYKIAPDPWTSTKRR